MAGWVGGGVQNRKGEREGREEREAREGRARE